MTKTYYALPLFRYYSDPASPNGLRAVEEPGHCNVWHELYRRGDATGLRNHTEICEICQDLIERSRLHVLSHPPAPSLHVPDDCSEVTRAKFSRPQLGRVGPHRLDRRPGDPLQPGARA